MRAYLTGILCAAFLCAVVNAVGSSGKRIRRLITGVFLVLSLLHPLGSLDLPAISLTPYLKEAQNAASYGAQEALTARNEIISGSLEAYILTKADELGLSIGIHVEVSPDGSPRSVSLEGAAGPSEREQLCAFITDSLGLEREDLEWK